MGAEKKFIAQNTVGSYPDRGWVHKIISERNARCAERQREVSLMGLKEKDSAETVKPLSAALIIEKEIR